MQEKRFILTFVLNIGPPNFVVCVQIPTKCTMQITSSRKQKYKYRVVYLTKLLVL